MEFETLLSGADVAPQVRRRIDDLLAQKRAGAELDRGPMIPEIHEFIESELLRIGSLDLARSDPPGVNEELDQLFREVVSNPRSGA